jgi:hypothetical protein
VSEATWTVTGVLSDLIEDSRRAEMHITVDEGLIVLFKRFDGSKDAVAVIQSARDLIGEKVIASGTIQPHADSKLRTPYFLSPSELHTG